MSEFDQDHHIRVKFIGNAMTYEQQCQLLLRIEIMAREISGKRIEVFQERRGDDSKLRAHMTAEQRAKL